MLRSPWFVARLRMSSQCCSNAGMLNFPVTYRTVGVGVVACVGVVAWATLTPIAMESAANMIANRTFMYPPSGCCLPTGYALCCAHPAGQLLIARPPKGEGTLSRVTHCRCIPGNLRLLSWAQDGWP